MDTLEDEKFDLDMRDKLEYLKKRLNHALSEYEDLFNMLDVIQKIDLLLLCVEERIDQRKKRNFKKDIIVYHG